LHEKNGAVEDKGELEFPLVIGVRRKDCSKLDKTRWSGWADYKKNFAKSYLVDHLDEIVASEKVMAYKEHSYNMENYRLLDCLLDNSKFHKVVRNQITDKNHPLIQIIDDIGLMKDDSSELETIFRLVNFLKKEDKEWVKENIPSTYDVNEFNTKCKEVSMKYPLLVNINKEIYSWQDMENNGADNFGKNICDYILMCDLV